jgi:hypothetical protein
MNNQQNFVGKRRGYAEVRGYWHAIFRPGRAALHPDLCQSSSRVLRRRATDRWLAPVPRFTRVLRVRLLFVILPLR